MSQKEKDCVICKEAIMEDYDDYVRLTDFKYGIENGEIFYHLECLRERFQITNSARKNKMYSQFSKSAKSILDTLGKGSGGGMKVSP